MVQTRQQIETLIQRNIHNLIRFDINRGENIVSFRLSDILNHVNETLALGDVLEMIYDYNLSHEDNKFPDEYIIQLWEFNMQVNKVIRAIINYSSTNISDRPSVIRYIKERTQFLSERISTIYEEIDEDVNSDNKSEIVSILQDKEFHFLRDTIGEVVERNLTNDDDNYESILFDRITVENIVVDM